MNHALSIGESTGTMAGEAIANVGSDAPEAFWMIRSAS